MAIVVEILNGGEATAPVATNNYTVIEVVSASSTPVTTTPGLAVVEVVGPKVLAGAEISAIAPPNPTEEQIWIDIS